MWEQILAGALQGASSGQSGGGWKSVGKGAVTAGLSALGTATLGPIGGIVGNFVGSKLSDAIFGSDEEKQTNAPAFYPSLILPNSNSQNKSQEFNPFYGFNFPKSFPNYNLWPGNKFIGGMYGQPKF